MTNNSCMLIWCYHIIFHRPMSILGCKYGDADVGCRVLDPQMNKIPQMYITSLKWLILNHVFINCAQMYKRYTVPTDEKRNWPQLTKSLRYANLKCIKINHKLALCSNSMHDKCLFRFYHLETIYCNKIKFYLIQASMHTSRVKHFSALNTIK